LQSFFHIRKTFSSLGLPTEQHSLPYKKLKLLLKQLKPFFKC